MTKKKKVSPLKGSSLWGVLAFAILLLIDMVTKFVADAYFSTQPKGEKIEIIPDWINLCITYNPGIAYGVGENAPKALKLGVVVATGLLMFVLSIVYFKLDKNRAWIRWAIVFIVAGGIGNFIDRVYYKVWIPSDFGVRDMVDLSRFGFAVCNFADFFICGGAAALMAALLFFDEDAMIPVGKYKQLAAEKEAAREAKIEAKNAGKKNG